MKGRNRGSVSEKEKRREDDVIRTKAKWGQEFVVEIAVIEKRLLIQKK